MKRTVLYSVVIVIVATAAFAYHRHEFEAVVPDAAKLAGRRVEDFPESASRVFDQMDGGVPLSIDETKGRNTWLLWTAGDETFWNTMAKDDVGIGDLLKTIDSRRRLTRFHEGGLINQPGFKTASTPDRYGLWIDEGSQEDGVDPKIYGKPTGIVGLRLFLNPKFDKAAEAHWNSEKYYSDRKYFEDRSLERPYLVGMTCGFCHVAFNPEHSPKDSENPMWSELSSTIGNQYLRASRVFGAGATDDSFAMQVLRSWPPGTIDTSFLATDHLNNPSKINPIFSLPARMTAAHEEDISGGSLLLAGAQKRMLVPHVLKDGADSVGIIGALSRVYVSIGEYSEEWLRDHNALLGDRRQRPFSIAKAQRGSIYWQATATKLNNIALFLMTQKSPELAKVDRGGTQLVATTQTLNRGKVAFAENCAGCHSSKQPDAKLVRGSSEYKAWMRNEVMKPDFLDNNFLSNENRIPVSIVQTNAARALATNAMQGHVWNDFSSDTYKEQKSAGHLSYVSVVDGSPQGFELPEGGPGYYRVASLRGIWATAPLLHNSAIGQDAGDPSAAGRLKVFDDAMKKLLWPENRSSRGIVWRTSSESYLSVPESSLPWELRWLAKDGALVLGPIPAGTPVDLIASADFEMRMDRLTPAKVKLLLDLRSVLNPKSAPTASQLKNIENKLLAISKCPDFIQDRGHTFGTRLPDADKNALIEYIKTF